MVIGVLALAAYPFMSTLDADVAYTEAAEATSKLHEVPFPCFSGAICSAIIIGDFAGKNTRLLF